MAHIENLKEQILDSAKKLAKTHGIGNINVRMVAKETGIALGTIYNYYPSKGDIIAAVIEGFWKSAFEGIELNRLKDLDLVDGLEEIYNSLFCYLKQFRENWLEELVLLNAGEKNIGRKKEKEYLGKVHKIILIALEEKGGIKESYTEEERLKLAEFIFENMIMMLRKDEQDFSLFKKILNKILS